MRKSRLVLRFGEYRIVQTEREVFVVERMSADSLGVERWEWVQTVIKGVHDYPGWIYKLVTYLSDPK